MTTKEFLDRYDSVSEPFTDRELEDLWRDDLIDVHTPTVRDKEYGEPDRWNTLVDKLIKIEDRYFMIYRYEGNTEYQETDYDMQPDEVYPVEKTIIVWEGVPKDNGTIH